MFTMKFFSGLGNYRCIAVREFEVARIPERAGTVDVVMTPLSQDAINCNLTIGADQWVIVENANGKTIDVIRP